MIKELDSIVLITDIPEYGLAAGDIGTVVMIHEKGQGFTVEFVSLTGETLGVVNLTAGQIRAVAHHEIAHARLIAA